MHVKHRIDLRSRYYIEFRWRYLLLSEVLLGRLSIEFQIRKSAARLSDKPSSLNQTNGCVSRVQIKLVANDGVYILG